jgi:hypothetical protein
LPSILSSGVKYRYSEKEKQMFEFLSKKPIDSATLVQAFYAKHRGNKPVNAAVALNGTMRSLMNKVEMNKEKFRIHKSDRRGPHPVEYWIEAA